ncbi:MULTISPECIES: hypothetical protein [Paenibacillus]|uniref:Ni2+-binding GTPase n=1 Tax=Paenibacillus campinasensis TaxID=66347 RepID=A0A268F2S0_9BACL|nr:MULTISPECIES: hypothetical protein [Paenibacillus]PAD79643.1 hypothetical protein CHH67_02685 [Paenibacillus campinasensis]PAK53506.1 hypothetical protein CHH75_09645 [Paenibacillus sp. 7541]
MMDKAEMWEQRIQELAAAGALTAEARALLHEMLEELKQVARQNMNLRKAVLKASGKEARMSSKLKDALME